VVGPDDANVLLILMEERYGTWGHTAPATRAVVP
jgi:hypothetical protein